MGQPEYEQIFNESQMAGELGFHMKINRCMGLYAVYFKQPAYANQVMRFRPCEAREGSLERTMKVRSLARSHGADQGVERWALRIVLALVESASSSREGNVGFGSGAQDLVDLGFA